VRRVKAMIVGLLVLVACGTAEPTAVWQSDGDDRLGLVITNQDFDRPHIELTVKLDGHRVVTGEFDVDDQHRQYIYELEVASGTRQLTVVSEYGDQAAIEVEVGDGQPWVNVAYWGESENPDSGPIDLRIHGELPGMD
jgi:major membrane immunogen (membrane-anchored lipoprotein)